MSEPFPAGQQLDQKIAQLERDVAGYRRGQADLLAQRALLRMQVHKVANDAGLSMGDRVEKTGGDYKFSGHVVALFCKFSGAVRVVVENDAGILHIFNPSQLTRIDVPTPE